MHVLGRHLRPRVLVTDGVPLDVDVRIAGVPAAGRLVDVPLQRDGDRGGLVRPNLDGAAVESILRPARDHELVVAGRQAGFITPVDIEGETVVRRPERPRVHSQQADLVGEPMEAHRPIGRERSPASGVVQTDARWNLRPAIAVAHVEYEAAESGGHGRRAAPLDGDVAQRDALPGAHREVGVLDASAREAGAAEGQGGAREGATRLRGDLVRDAEAFAAVLVPPNNERRRQPGGVGQREGDRLVNVEGVVVVDVKGEDPADEARLPLDIPYLHHAPAARGTQLGSAHREHPRNAIPLPRRHLDIARLSAVTLERRVAGGEPDHR